LEKMHMKASRNNDETAVDDLLFKGNTWSFIEYL
jgi:hypothetical protein